MDYLLNVVVRLLTSQKRVCIFIDIFIPKEIFYLIVA